MIKIYIGGIGKMKEKWFEKMGKTRNVIAVAAVFAVCLIGMCACGDDYDYSSLAGEYQDSESQRASMTIEKDDDGGVEIEIIWGTSATETTEWSMDAYMKDGKLVYDEAERETTLTDDNGTVVSENEVDEPEGYFELGDNGQLLWKGAEQEECRKCCFEKISQ